MQVLKMLYDKEIVAEEAVLAWADEKESAEAHERVFLKRCACSAEMGSHIVAWFVGRGCTTICTACALCSSPVAAAMGKRYTPHLKSVNSGTTAAARPTSSSGSEKQRRKRRVMTMMGMRRMTRLDSVVTDVLHLWKQNQFQHARLTSRLLSGAQLSTQQQIAQSSWPDHVVLGGRAFAHSRQFLPAQLYTRP